MPTPSTSDLPKPKSWNEFEDIVWEIYRRKWQDPHAQRYGRSGQTQHGVDIYGQCENSNQYIAIQCKRYENNKLNARIIEAEVTKAEGFSSPISEYILATTASRDTEIQDFVRNLSERRRAQGKFAVHVIFWDDISSDLADPNNQDLLLKYYSHWKDVFSSSEDSKDDDYISSYYEDYLPQVQTFVGRGNELQKLVEEFQRTQILVIGGSAGIGKTYLTARFIELHCNAESVVWIECEFTQAEKFLAQLAYIFSQRFADPSLLSVIRGSASDSDTTIKKVVSLINKYSCLLIFDNYHCIENEPFFSQLISACGRYLRNGRIIITTRKWHSFDNLFNQPYVLAPLDRLDIDSAITLLRNLGIENVPDELLAQACNHLDGHPKFLTLLAALSKMYPLKSLLQELPYIPDRIYEHLQESVFAAIGNDGRDLLLKLAVFDVPFTLSVISSLVSETSAYYLFDKLKTYFLVARVDQKSDYYIVHSLEKEAIRRDVPSSNIREIHKHIHVGYYETLDHGTYLDANRSVYHALAAGLWGNAKRAINRLLNASLSFGLYDLILEDIDWITEYEEANLWFFVHFIHGYVARIKEDFLSAIEAYETAISLAETTEDKEKAEFELASVLVKAFDDGLAQDINKPKSIYKQLLLSNNLEVKVLAMSSLASIEFREDNAQCIKLLKQAFSIAQANDLISKVPFIPFELARAYAKFHGNLDRAIQYAQESIDIQKNLGFDWNMNPEPWHHAHDLLGSFLLAKDRFEEAVAAYKVCVEVDTHLKLETRLARSLFHLGRAFCISGLYEDALKSFAQSLFLVDKYQIDRSLQLDNIKWFVIATWYKGSYKEAMSLQISYLEQCMRYQVESCPVYIAREQDLMAGARISDILQSQDPFLVLPSKYEMEDLQRWSGEIVKEHPEWGELAMVLFRPKEDTKRKSKNRQENKSSLARNAPCPCGSGKKYKHCCGR